MNAKSMINRGIITLVIVFLITACATPTPPPPPPALTATIIPTETPIPNTPTPSATATPSFTLSCTLVTGLRQETRPANVFGVVLMSSSSPNAPEVTALQIDILGESGQPTSAGTIPLNEFLDGGKLQLTIDEELTYQESQNIYKVSGVMLYTTAMELLSYEMTVSGGGFGNSSQTCTYP